MALVGGAIGGHCPLLSFDRTIRGFRMRILAGESEFLCLGSFPCKAVDKRDDGLH